MDQVCFTPTPPFVSNHSYFPQCCCFSSTFLSAFLVILSFFNPLFLMWLLFFEANHPLTLSTIQFTPSLTRSCSSASSLMTRPIYFTQRFDAVFCSGCDEIIFCERRNHRNLKMCTVQLEKDNFKDSVISISLSYCIISVKFIHDVLSIYFLFLLWSLIRFELRCIKSCNEFCNRIITKNMGQYLHSQTSFRKMRHNQTLMHTCWVFFFRSYKQ